MTRFTPFTHRHGSVSIDDLVEQLGGPVSRLPMDALPKERPSFGCSFRSIPPVPRVDMSAVDRLQEAVASLKAEKSPEELKALYDEWRGM